MLLINGCLNKLSKSILISLLAMTVLAGGCTSKYGTQTTKVTHYPDCYSPINELRKNEFAVQKGVAGGAVAGAALGALIGYATTGKGSGALAGAAVGGVAGATAGGLYASSEKSGNDAARLAEYNSRLEGGIQEVDKATAAAKLARQCYDRQFAVAASEFKAGHITREQFNSRYQEVVSGMEEAANILGMANKNSADVVASYNKAIDEEAQRQNVPVASVRSRSSAQRASVTRTSEGRELTRLADTTSNMQSSVSAGKEEERLLRERLAATHQQAKDLMS